MGQEDSDYFQKGSWCPRAKAKELHVVERSEHIPESESRKKSKKDGGTVINLTFLPLGNLNFQNDSYSEVGRKVILECELI